MSEVICKYLPSSISASDRIITHLAGSSRTRHRPAGRVDELAQGLAAGLNLPDLPACEWVVIRRPVSVSALPLITDLGPGETEVLMLALESQDSVAILDDALARRVAESQGIRIIGTLGVLLNAKRAGCVSSIREYVDQLEALRFRLAPQTRASVLKLADELT